ncbi:type I restriction endonuclease subunit R [Brucella gallinifaecis]|uniref:Type I restriction enzyme endonuclease subunit n=1 Tax=Brucella gallinifaecis TaxID=215590 RepID=A0A502BLU2_9HYPH|nr:HsdR family type I site-specific deoxyribonuclease [Brucella gallinifaecis]TPF74053.1 type I restriction endonuclease subunit R [Brucella gallinifaecis]
MTSPNTAEQFTAHLPALQVLLALGWQLMSTADCLAARGGNKAVILRSVLVDELKKRRFEYKGRSYPLSTNAIDQIVRDLSAPQMHEGLLSANEKLYNAMTLGITVTEFVEGKKHSATVPIIDWNNPANNSLIVTEEFEVLSTDGIRTRRPDIVCFINGLPLAVIEVKRPDSGNPNKSMVDEGISQTIRNQKPDEIPHLFAYSQLLVSISGTDGRYATTKTPKKFWAKWSEEEFDETHFYKVKNAALPPDVHAELLSGKPRAVQDHFQNLWSGIQFVTDQDRLLISLLSPERLLEFIRYFIIFDRKVGKVAARYQQAFGIKALIERISDIRPDGGREGGVIWHTTGSGKSFTMVYLCKALLLRQELAECRVIVVTDRVDLEKQLARTFLTGGAMGTTNATKKDENRAKASTGRDLAKRIGKGNERIIFSIINKFGTASKLPECYNPSENIIVLIDEGHRSQDGENHERMKKALPNAAYVAFTGTPLLKNEKTTNKFGPIVHAYTMQKAVQDGTVTPLLYEERKPIIDINASAIDNWFEKITASLTDQQKSDLKEKYGKKGQLYGSANRIDLIAWDIAAHFNDNFKKLGKDLKGQLATDSKLSAVRYKKALDATSLVSSAIVISAPDSREGHEDVDESELPEVQQWWKDNVKGDPAEYERQVIEDFGEPGAPDILIVVDKLLTGFDEPKNAVLYIDKPLKQHNLIQAIARVNRLHDEKKFGLLIDYRGILKELDTAITEYRDLAERTQGGFDVDDIEGLYANVSTEYKKLPALHAALWEIFRPVQNRADREQYRQLLIPYLTTGANGESVDLNQKIREDFYQALTEFGMCLKVALGSRSFFEDKSFSEDDIQAYKRDLRFFSELRRTAKQDAQETIDFSVYEDQIRKLVDRYVVGERVKDADGVYIVNDLGKKSEPETWSEEKTRNETDIIRSRLKRTIEQELADDPYAQSYFSELLRKALAEANALFEHPFKQYALFKELDEKVKNRSVEGIPPALSQNQHAAAYFGILKLEHGADDLSEELVKQYVELCISIDDIITVAVAENSLNTQDIEASVRKKLLPLLFKRLGLESAKSVVDKIVEIIRLGLSKGTL